MLFLLFALSACPYQSDFPLDVSPKQKADSSLIGTWFSTDKSNFETLRISIHSDSVYQVIRDGKVQEGDVISKKTVKMNGFVSSVGNRFFINLERPGMDGKEQQKPGKSYLIAGFEISRGVKYDTLRTNIVERNSFASYEIFKNSFGFSKTFTGKLRSGNLIYDATYSASYIRIVKK